MPPFDSEADILLLIGRYLVEAHHVHDQRNGPLNTPYAQNLSLGWVIIGETCLGKIHKTDSVSVKKTYIFKDGQETIFKPRESEFIVSEKHPEVDIIGSSVFRRTKEVDRSTWVYQSYG